MPRSHLAVNLVPRWVPQLALALVVAERRLGAVALEAEFAQPNERQRGQDFGVGGKVPRLYVVLPQLNHLRAAQWQRQR